MDRIEFVKRMTDGETVYMLKISTDGKLYGPQEIKDSVDLADEEFFAQFGGKSIRYESADSVVAAI